MEVHSRATVGRSGTAPWGPRGPGTPRAEGSQDIAGLSGHREAGNGSIRNLSVTETSNIQKQRLNLF